MNVVEAYKKNFEQLVILITGLAGSGKHELAKNIQADFMMKIIDMRDYLDKENVKLEEIRDTKVKNYFRDDAYKWDEINKDLESNKKNGVILVGDVINIHKINTFIDFRINLKLQKDSLIKKRQEIKEDLDLELEKTIINKLEIPYSIEVSNKEGDVSAKIKYTKYINANDFANLEKDEYNKKIYDEAFDYLINLIKSRLDKEGDINKIKLENNPTETDESLGIATELEKENNSEEKEDIKSDSDSNESLNIEDSSDSDSEIEASFIPQDEE